MKEIRLVRASCIEGEPKISSDKSISHRISMLSAFLNNGRIFVEDLSDAVDCKRTVNALKKLGVKVRKEGSSTVFEKMGNGLCEPKDVLYLGNSGTSARLLLGILSSQPYIHAVITGDSSLRKRPMKRVAEPLRSMGAKIWAREDNFLPISVLGQRLSPINYTLPIPSAQVKSAIIFAALSTNGESVLQEPIPTRDHTERMLSFFNAPIFRDGKRILVKGPFSLKGEFFYKVPSDISGAAFFIVAATILENSSIYLRDICINPTRAAFLSVLSRMGAKISIKRKGLHFNEEIADIEVKHSKLKGINIEPEEVPLLIDEIPALSIAAANAEGVTCIRGAKELRYKETDRIKALVDGLKKMGIKTKEFEDGLMIEGGRLKGAVIQSFGDHRIAMAFCIAALVAEGESLIKNTACISTSFPEFERTLFECVRW